MPTEDEAVEMFARYFHSTHKDLASRRARKTADSLNTKGDLSGHRIWSKVADQIEQYQMQRRQSQERHAVLLD